MQRNPLIIPILDILREAREKIGEYDLICKLEQRGFEFPVEDESYNMAMFKKHFMTMNALYHLQQELFEDGYYLDITALDINIQPLAGKTEQQAIMDSAEQKVRDYYLDWSHYDATTEAEIEKLLKGFWDKYFAIDKQADALKVLELGSEATWDEIKQAYRRLVIEHHPDKGGSSKRFIEIREAYEVLRCVNSA